ncbi:lysophospholipid acyltransferase family protein [soil metagenome]
MYGVERVPEDGRLIIAANHTQYLDPVYVCVAVPRRVQWMAKKELFVFPFKGVLSLLGAFPIDRQKAGRATIRASQEVLESGMVLGIFPEGTHRQGESSREAKSGVVVLAARSGAPLLPVYVSAAPGLLGRLKGKKMYACIGKPVNVDSNLRGGKAYREVADNILRQIYALPDEYGLAEKL